MRIRVLKFGGTSLADVEGRARAVRHVVDALREGVRPVVVVSAMGRRGEPYATDTLMELMARTGAQPQAREIDLLLSCGELISAAVMCGLLQKEGVPARAMTGAMAGIVTDERHGDARIVDVRPQAVRKWLHKGYVVVVAGFQGKSRTGEITTLGRGGSDTSATALAAALQAERADIFTDVDGVLTADPRIVAEARRLDRVSYTEICSMAYNGAKVIHPRAVEIAMQARLPIRVRSTFSDDEGTLVASPPARAEGDRVRERLVTGIAHSQGLTQIQVRVGRERYDLHMHVFKAMAKHQISVDFLSVTPSDILFTVSDEERARALRILREELGCDARSLPGCAKISVVGGGMNGVPGVMARIAETLIGADIPILQTADSNTTIWVLVEGGSMVKAVRALHRAFQLHE